MALPQAKTPSFTYADYAAWDDGARWELLEGEPAAMTPAPGTRHQDIVLEVGARLKDLAKRDGCRVMLSPCDVLLDALAQGRDASATVVQPDLLVVCDRSRIKPHGVEGPPDLVVEVLSPSSLVRDTIVKHRLYEMFGVREFWIIDPMGQRLHQFLRDDAGKLTLHRVWTPEETLECGVLPEARLELAEVFAPAGD